MKKAWLRKTTTAHKLLKRGRLGRLAMSVLEELINFKRRQRWNALNASLGQSLVQRTVQGSVMFLDPCDAGVSRDLFLEGVREPVATQIMKKILRPGMKVVDIGANIGYYALLEARLVGERGKVYAIEPFSQNINLLGRSIKANGYKNIETFRRAIGDYNGLTKLCVTDGWNTCFIGDGDMLFPTEEVEILTLDNFLKDKQQPDLARMDVEGYEDKIIDGMHNTLEIDNLWLFIELHGPLTPGMSLQSNPRHVLETLRNFNFETEYVVYSTLPNIITRRPRIRKVSISDLLKSRRLDDRVFHIFLKRGE